MHSFAQTSGSSWRTPRRIGHYVHFLMWGVAPHRIDVYIGDGQETRRNNYNMSQPQYNHVNVNVIVM